MNVFDLIGEELKGFENDIDFFNFISDISIKVIILIDVLEVDVYEICVK